MAYKTLLGMSPYRVVYGKSCHLLLKLEHRTWWATSTPNSDLTAAAEERILQLSELEEIRAEVHENARLPNERVKLVHGKTILRKDFTLDMKVLLYDLILHLFAGKLKPQWKDPFVVSHVFPYDAVDIQYLAIGIKKKDNG